jgi:FixJ family two-component response regulator
MGDNYKGVAIIDDDLDVLDSLKFLVEAAGYTVDIYGSAAAFLEAHTPRPACLILDHHMPQMTGLELASRLRSMGMAIPTLLMTAQPSPAIIAHATQLGIKVLSKPPTEDELLSFIEAHY